MSELPLALDSVEVEAGAGAKVTGGGVVVEVLERIRRDTETRLKLEDLLFVKGEPLLVFMAAVASAADVRRMSAGILVRIELILASKRSPFLGRGGFE